MLERVERKKVATQYRVELDTLEKVHNPEDMEDVIWARLDREIAELLRDREMHRIRGIEHRAEIVSIGLDGGARIQYKEYRAVTMAVDNV
jgi:hypothetical protein